MKKIFTLSITLILVLALSACAKNATTNGKTSQQNQNNAHSHNDPSPSAPSQQPSQTTEISRDKALEIALNTAGVNQADIRNLDIELDRERGELVWEVDFEHANLEYSYDVNAATGAITKATREFDD